MIDTTLVPFAYGFLVVAALAFAAAVTGISVALRDLRGTAVPVVVSVSGAPERSYSRAA